MLSKTEEGARGLAALFSFYQENYGLDAASLVQKYGYTLCVEEIPMPQGQLAYAEKRVIVSQEGPPVLREFVIFHEMAHYCLHPIAPIFGAGLLVLDKADDIEYWCDHFALAMFFAFRRARLLDEHDYVAFLTQGNEAAYDGRDSWAPWRQSAVLARRIPTLAKKFFKPKTTAYLECVALKYAHILVSKLIRLREAENSL